jgi:prokaryotic ubiquitin-like protein Pup
MTDREHSMPREQEEDTEIEVVEEVESTVTDDVDDLLDEIDSVLEENAEEFVRNYVQKGGE